jgi:hypothetical protein
MGFDNQAWASIEPYRFVGNTRRGERAETNLSETTRQPGQTQLQRLSQSLLAFGNHAAAS